jgi:uncharacterized protein (TIGR02145 family)
MKSIITLAATLTLAITLTLTACEEKKKQDGTDTTATEPTSEAWGATPIQEPAAAVAEKPAENAVGGDTQDGCPNAVIGNGTLSCGGQTYKTVKIGEQVWMAENLNYAAKGSKCFGEGGKVVDVYEDGNDSTTLSKAEIQANCTKYGRLYNWETAKTVCPAGWHLPSHADWNVLMKFVNPSCSDNEYCNAGTKLKATSGWNDDYEGESGNGTDNFGFSALPGGYGNSGGSFHSGGGYGTWWSATEYDASKAYHRNMDTNSDAVHMFETDKSSFFSVRCIKD